MRRAGALAAACVLFAPGFWLAAHQPRQSMEWLLPRNLPFPPSLSFAGEYPYALFASVPPWGAWLALLVLLAALAGPLARRRAGGRPAPVPGDPPGIAVLACATSIPLLLAIALGLYFPMRLESVIAAPMALWVALSLDAWSRPIRRLLFGLLVAFGLLASCVGISDHALRPLDDYRAAALWTARHAAPGERVVASGYCYLETVVAAGPRVTAFPSEQAAHPGWRATSRMDAKPPEGPFLWIGELAAPELAILRGTRKVEPVYVNARALVARVR